MASKLAQTRRPQAHCTEAPGQRRPRIVVAAAQPERLAGSAPWGAERRCAAVAAAAAAAGGVAGVRLSPEEKARHSRPPGWTAPGPPPAGPRGDPDLAPRPGESLSYLCGDWRIFQLEAGHRWSMDDHVTAVVALQEAAAAPRPVRHALDLGCGCGSVLMMVGWGLPEARCVGVEAQAISIGLARRSVRYNAGDSGRIAVLRGDLRDPLPPGVAPPGGFDLVTGTPPYVPLDCGGASARPQKAPCNLETRGGVEGYVAAAARALAPGGACVLVMGVQGQRRPDRVREAAAAHGMAVSRCVDVVPRAGKPVLMQVWVLRWGADAAAAGPERREEFVVRLADGALAPDMHAARAAIGMPPARSGAPPGL
ncbi:hypothetical protein Rsub_12835 [Raphidocelis subcapitata]|uniref:Uncharacterized protein n=1 Tax=Raphidocelis subcapitata TaxID=307507 RepID=A0A2V0PPP0_9CHLO|nr:hypothetical protein Rsub_12835 [Raphidocelis subcapitata]|eukprot:GBG00144.1 hypothetical protein Rsub_12835 [Raphidocelis subcapitata]